MSTPAVTLKTQTTEVSTTKTSAVSDKITPISTSVPVPTTSTLSSASAPLPQAPITAQTVEESLLENTKPKYEITGWVGKSVEFVRDITGANRKLTTTSEKVVAFLVKSLLIFSIAITGGGILILPFGFHTVEWLKQGRHNEDLKLWLKDNDEAVNLLQTTNTGKLLAQVKKLQNEVRVLHENNAVKSQINDEDADTIGSLTVQLNDSVKAQDGLTETSRANLAKLKEATDQRTNTDKLFSIFKTYAENERTALLATITTLEEAKAALEHKVHLSEPLIADGAIATEQVKVQKKEIETLNNQWNAAQEQLKTADDRLATALKQEKANAEKQLQEATGQVTALKANLDTATNEKIQLIETTKKEYQALNDKLTAVNVEKDAAQNLLDQTKAEKGRVEGTAVASAARIKELTEELTAKENEHGVVTETLNQLNKDHLALREKLNEQIAQLNTKVTNAQKAQEKAEIALNAVRVENVMLNEKLEAANAVKTVTVEHQHKDVVTTTTAATPPAVNPIATGLAVTETKRNDKS